MVLSIPSLCFGFCLVTIGAVCFLQFLHPKVELTICSAGHGCQPRISGDPIECRNSFFEAKRLGEKCLEDYESCNLDKADCLGRQSSQDTSLLEKYSLLLSEYQMMHQSAYGRQGSLTRNQMERIARSDEILQTKPSMIQWKPESESAFEATFETQQDLVHRVQNRDNVLCRDRFSVGPYYIQIAFSIGTDEEHTASVIIEIPSRLYLPHTVLTFLTLVEAEDYSGSNVSVSPTALSIEANHQFDEIHEGHATLSFIESSAKFPCEKHSVGFLGYGPQFMVFLDDLDEEHNANENRTCFGRVVRGIESIQILQSDAAKDSGIQVAWSRNLDL